MYQWRGGSLWRSGPLLSPVASCSEWGLPCLAGHPASGALLPHLFTLTFRHQINGGVGGLFSVALSIGGRVSEHRPVFRRAPCPWSSDFPPAIESVAGGAPSVAFKEHKRQQRCLLNRSPDDRLSAHPVIWLSVFPRLLPNRRGGNSARTPSATSRVSLR